MRQQPTASLAAGGSIVSFEIPLRAGVDIPDILHKDSKSSRFDSFMSQSPEAESFRGSHPNEAAENCRNAYTGTYALKQYPR